MAPPRTRSALHRAALATYAFFYNKKVGVILILLMAVATLLGTVITQAPEGVMNSAEHRELFLADMRARYGGWAMPLAWLGIFSIYTSPLFLLLCGLLALSILACTTHRLPLLWRKATRPRTRVSAKFFARAQYRGQVPTEADHDAALAAARAALRRAHYRVLDANGEGPAALYGDRGRFGPFGTVCAHAAFIVIIAALCVSNLTGIDTTLEIPVGTSAPVGHNTGWQIEARSFTDSYDEAGRPTDYVSHLVLRDSRGATLADQDVRVNSPLRHDGYAFHQASYGFSALVEITRSGRDLYRGGVALSQRSGDGLFTYGVVDLPRGSGRDTPAKLIIATPASGQHPEGVASGQALVRVLGPGGDDNVLGEAVVDPGSTHRLADVAVTFKREAPYTGITVRRDPGAPLMWLGSILLVAGMSATFGLRHRRVWVRVVDGCDAADVDGTGRMAGAATVVEIASVDTADSAYERHFARLVSDINSHLTTRQDSPATTA